VVQPSRAPVVGLALGGGAARGFAHVGVIQVLEENGIKVDLLAGTSAGSVVAVQYASGMNASQLQQAALTMDEAMLTDWTIPLFGRGLLRGEALARYVNQQVNQQTLEQLRIPVGVLATNLGTGQGVLFRRGHRVRCQVCFHPSALGATTLWTEGWWPRCRLRVCAAWAQNW
jgi:NTE family protein